ncbi:MAG: type IV toxin-antitoxin system AbiEi family antitoxin domain-containing protein [Acidimicrobiales bacterium]|nr:type IV toxin-antitoxin system AbiEi family antitoxin domain-containing protein [Acidimicrobiales bacterium]
MANGIDIALGVQAARQHGTFARAQALALGADDALIKRRLRQARWERVAPGVYRLPGVPRSFVQRVWIAYLATGPLATVSFETAGAFSDFSGYPERDVVLTVPHGGHARIPGAFVHQISDVLPHHVTLRHGLRCTTPERTAVDLASITGYARLLTVVDDARARHRLSLAGTGEVLAEVARRGKPGVRRMARVLDALGPGTVPPMSQLERRLHALVERAGLPPLVRQLPLPGRQMVRGCADGGWPDAKMLVEVDGRTWHTRIADLKRDTDRDAETGRAGWLTRRLLYERVTGDPEGVAELLRETREVRLAQLGAPAQPA